jgi:hypothetical protein
MKAIQPIALNATMDIVAFLYPTDIQWNREYYKCGDFSIQIPVNQYSNDMVFIYTKDRPEIGRITQINYKQDESGYQYVQLSGYFLENDLNDAVLYPAYWGHGYHVDDVIKSMVSQHYSGVNVAANRGAGTATNFNAELGASLGEQVYDILRLHEMSCKVTYDFDNAVKVFDTWQGADHTQGTANPIIFSTAFGNLKNPDIVTTETSNKNYIIVAGKADQQDIYETVDLSDGAPLKKIFVSATGVNYDANTMTLAQYKQNLRDFGRQELLNNHSTKTNVAFDVLANSYEYLTDFNLGDKCTVVIPEVGIELSTRIISVHEVGAQGEYKISLEFGDDIVINTGA